MQIDDVKKISKYSLRNKVYIENSENCACYFCLKKFEPKDIEKWIDCGETALCPKCGVDSVVGDSVVLLDSEFLKKASTYWFW